MTNPVRSKKKSSKRRKFSRDASPSNNSSSSSEYESGEDYEHFNNQELDETFKLPSNLSKFAGRFAGRHFEKCVSNDIMNKMLEDCKVPENEVFKAPELDQEWGDVLEEDRKGYAIKKWDANLVRMQDAVNKTMGPLSSIWTKIDAIKKNKGESHLDLEDTLESIEKAVICVGQANVQIKYFRRLALVSHMVTGNAKKASKMLVNWIRSYPRTRTPCLGKRS